MIDPRPLRYDLTLEPDLENFNFHGKVAILFESLAQCSRVDLDCRDLEIKGCRMTGFDENSECRFALQPSDDLLAVELPRTVSGRFNLEIVFRGIIGKQMTGFYRSRYLRQDGRQGFLAVTQFQENYARQAFPCLDRPEAKAVFHLQLVVPAGVVAISNTGIENEVSLPDGRKKISFGPSPKMSTYLLFWGLGPFETVIASHDQRVRARVLPGQEQAVKNGLQLGSRALQFCEQYFGIGYPLPKLDLIAVADFAYGAMENWGAITFRENLLLEHPETTPQEARLYIAEVISHEIVHQWFGNLVTPSGWKYLWLNESFATYLAYKFVAAEKPEWKSFDHFCSREVDSALQRDGLPQTVAIEISGHGQMAINTATAPIIYSKGGSMLRMLEGYMGPEAFRLGIRSYLQKHAYDCAASNDLWDSFEEASDLPIAGMIRRWVEQPGYPMLTVRLGNGRIHLSQSRFTYLDTTEEEQIWPLPLCMVFSDGRREVGRRTMLMEDRQMELELEPGCSACLVNAGRTAFLRVFYSQASMRSRLAGMASAGRLEPVDRWALEDDFFAALRKGLLTIEEYLDLVSASRPAANPDLLVCSAAARHLWLIDRICGEENTSRVRQLGRSLAVDVLDSLGWQPGEDDTLPQVMLRSRMLWYAAYWGHDRAVEKGINLYKKWLTGQGLEPDLAGTALKIGAREGDLGQAENMIARMETTDSEHLRLEIAGALGWFKDPRVLLEVLDMALEKIPARLQHISIGAAAENPVATRAVFQWFLKSLPGLEKLHPILFERVLTSIIPLCGITSADPAFRFLENYGRSHPELEDVLRLAKQWLEVNLRLVEATCVRAVEK